MNRTISLLVLIGLALFQGSAFARLDSASVSPATVTVAVNRAASINLTWSVTASPLNVSPSIATSSQLVVMSPGHDITFMTIPHALSRTIAPGATASIVETVQIPLSIVQSLKRANETQFRLYRTFTDDNLLFQSAEANLFLTGGSGARLQIDRLSLSFDDQSTQRVVSKDERFTALLDIRFSGTSMLRGVWELATPASTSGEPIYTKLGLVRQALTGNRTQRLESPVLPTRMPGIYLLRFRVTEPAGFEPVIIRYLVIQSETAEPPPVNIQPLSPGNGALLSADTRFAWRTDAKAKTWQLEVYAKPAGGLPDLGGTTGGSDEPKVEGPPVTGMMLPGKTTETGLTKIVRDHLEPGRGYWWRIRAIGDDGQLVGESPLIEFRTP